MCVCVRMCMCVCVFVCVCMCTCTSVNKWKGDYVHGYKTRMGIYRVNNRVRHKADQKANRPHFVHMSKAVRLFSWLLRSVSYYIERFDPLHAAWCCKWDLRSLVSRPLPRFIAGSTKRSLQGKSLRKRLGSLWRVRYTGALTAHTQQLAA